MDIYNVYSLFDICIERGQGCTVWDDHGQEYLDMYGGHAVISVGHCHPHYVAALAKQIETLGFYSNSVISPLQTTFAERLGKVSGYEDYHLFLVSSGAEANENALKLASFHTGRTQVLAAQRAFHGRTSLAVEVTDNKTIIAPINANGHVTHLPIGDITPWREALATRTYCAVIIECIQGVGGIRVADTAFIQELRQLCEDTGTMFIADEIQSGYGRSGKFFAHQYCDIRPDIITSGKGICNGFPMGGVLISPKIPAVKNQLGTTFGGNHLACAGAIAVIDIIERERLVENAKTVGDYLLSRLREEHLPHITDIRGRGLMIGLELDIPYKEPRTRLVKEQHCFTGCAGTNVIRLLPPLSLTIDQAEDFIQRIKRVL